MQEMEDLDVYGDNQPAAKKNATDYKQHIQEKEISDDDAVLMDALGDEGLEDLLDE